MGWGFVPGFEFWFDFLENLDTVVFCFNFDARLMTHDSEFNSDAKNLWAAPGPQSSVLI